MIDVSDQDITGGQVTHYLLETPTRKRVDMLRKIANLPEMHALVFFKQTATLEEVYQKLQHHHIPVAMLSSNGRQTERQQALVALKKGKLTFILTLISQPGELIFRDYQLLLIMIFRKTKRRIFTGPDELVGWVRQEQF